MINVIENDSQLLLCVIASVLVDDRRRQMPSNTRDSRGEGGRILAEVDRPHPR